MDIALNEDERLIQEAARDFATRAVAPTAAQRDRDESFPEELIGKLARLGFLGVKVGEAYGGAGAGYVGYALTIRELARACGATAVTVAVTNLVADALAKFGDEAQKERFLRPLVGGALGCGAFCLSEPECGSDATALRATARRDGDHYVLEGTKQWVSNGSLSGLFLVFATLDRSAGSKGITAFLVERGTPGLVLGRAEDKMGLRSSSTLQIVLEDARVPAANRIGPEGEGIKIALGGLDTGRVGVAAQACGIGEAALAEGVAYAKDRRAFGKPIGQQQAIQWMLADTATELDAAWLLTLRAASLQDAKLPVTSAASMAKLYASEACGRAVDRMLQVHGGYGYTKDYAIERLYRDARVLRIYEGTSEIQRLVIGRQLLQ